MKNLFFAALLGLLATQVQATENIGNNEVDLAVQAIMNSDDGLSVEEKIYKLWQEAEGSIPETGCYSGLGVSELGINDAFLCLAESKAVTGGGITLVPSFKFGGLMAYTPFRSVERPYTEPYDPIQHINFLESTTYSQKEEFKSTVNQGSLVIPYLRYDHDRSQNPLIPVYHDEAGLVVKFRARQIAPGVIAGVMFKSDYDVHSVRRCPVGIRAYYHGAGKQLKTEKDICLVSLFTVKHMDQPTKP